MKPRKSPISKFKIHIILWCLAVFMLLIGIMNFHSSFVNRNYKCVDGKITNLEEVQVLQKPGLVKRYNYVIEWWDNGQSYKKRIHQAIDRPNLSLNKVWVNPDNTDAILAAPSQIENSAYINFAIAAVMFIIGKLLAPSHNKKTRLSKDQLESIYYTLIVTVVVMVIGDIFMIGLYYDIVKKKIYITPAFWDLIIVFTVIIGVVILGIIKLKKKIK